MTPIQNQERAKSSSATLIAYLYPYMRINPRARGCWLISHYAFGNPPLGPEFEYHCGVKHTLVGMVIATNQAGVHKRCFSLVAGRYKLKFSKRRCRGSRLSFMVPAGKTL